MLLAVCFGQPGQPGIRGHSLLKQTFSLLTGWFQFTQRTTSGLVCSGRGPVCGWHAAIRAPLSPKALHCCGRCPGMVHPQEGSIFHYLDDFIVMAPPGSDDCKRSLDLLVSECQTLGVPLAMDWRAQVQS